MEERPLIVLNIQRGRGRQLQALATVFACSHRCLPRLSRPNDSSAVFASPLVLFRQYISNPLVRYQLFSFSHQQCFLDLYILLKDTFQHFPHHLLHSRSSRLTNTLSFRKSLLHWLYSSTTVFTLSQPALIPCCALIQFIQHQQAFGIGIQTTLILPTSRSSVTHRPQCVPKSSKSSPTRSSWSY